ncbi:endolytic transglycosylase MltG [Pseudomonas matsuisoli]|uniref:Endolytic murein transglycosylase n=1 Tax=Pseudomonas matsuisoli TaxID=1515666 RepID=A0A917PT97_9PSED|nr:endolytic transglycosylase MltG [Pseudomonas matsuisoli]GGJ90572.1 aminodeoxychorismate lyase [Pseudomonas matsuisoli]
MIRKLFKCLLGVCLLALIALGFAWWKQNAILAQPLKVTEERLIDVPQGTTPGGLLRQLEADGVLEDAFLLRIYWRFKLSEHALHSGEYRLMPGETVQDLLSAWIRGDVVQYAVTLVEGWNFRQVRAALAANPKLNQTLAEASDEDVMATLGEEGMHPEGRFFPDTYRYVKGMSDLDILRQAHQRLTRILAEEWAKRAENLPYDDSYQALIMASLVEKETGVPQERGQIAGVFVRRLEEGMLLQTDPTVIYGMGEQYKGRITRDDLRRPTPYNTYTNAGLPPTPIAIVGRESIHAALNPESGKSLYFVARGDGSHVFSNTLDEHNRAVREYQIKRRADYRSSPAPAAPAEKEAP